MPALKRKVAPREVRNENQIDVRVSQTYARIEGEILGVHDGLLKAHHKKPRSSKWLTTQIPLSRVVTYSADAKFVVYTVDSTTAVHLKGEVIGHEHGLVKLDTTDGIVFAAPASLSICAEDPTEPGTGRGRGRRPATATAATPVKKGKLKVVNKKGHAPDEDEDY